MPKTKKPEVKTKKLTPAERSAVAKARWAKRRAAGEPDTPIVSLGSDVYVVTTTEPITAGSEPVSPTPSTPSSTPPPTAPDQPVIPQNPTPEQPPVAPESVVVPFPSIPPVAAPQGEVPQPAVKKQKRIPVPKEFLHALKTADKRLSDAIEEYEDCQQRITYLERAIPRLQRTVMALRNESNPDEIINATAPTYNMPVSAPAALGFPTPQPMHVPVNMQSIMSAVPQPPTFKGTGGAMQFTPDMGEALEGPENDDPDQFITGPLAGGGWA